MTSTYFIKILLIYVETAASEIQNTIFVSRQPAVQNIYLTTYQNKTKNLIFSEKKGICKNICDYLRH